MQNNLSDQLYDIYGMSYTPWWQTTTFYVMGASSICLLVFGLIYYLLRARWAQKKVLTPFQQAMLNLEELRRTTMQPGQAKLFYDTLMKILKDYLHARFGYDTQGKTDHELIDYLKTMPIADQVAQELQSIVNGGLYVRFANQQAIITQMEHDYATAVAIVKKTQPTHN